MTGFFVTNKSSLDSKEKNMSTIRIDQATTLTPDQYIAGLTDFGPGREKPSATAPTTI